MGGLRCKGNTWRMVAFRFCVGILLLRATGRENKVSAGAW
jgi:UPF0716 family protein affecting phage T7 exclusion